MRVPALCLNICGPVTSRGVGCGMLWSTHGKIQNSHGALGPGGTRNKAQSGSFIFAIPPCGGTLGSLQVAECEPHMSGRNPFCPLKLKNLGVLKTANRDPRPRPSETPTDPHHQTHKHAPLTQHRTPQENVQTYARKLSARRGSATLPRRLSLSFLGCSFSM